MPRISAINRILEAETSEAIEWIAGDITPVTGSVTDNFGATYDISSATLTVACEFYTADIEAGTGRAATLSVSNLVLNESMPVKEISATPHKDYRGQYTFTIPEDFYEAPGPAADLSTGVPVAVCYLRIVETDQTHQVRFLVVIRRGGSFT